jgi:hypothetical protein
MLGILPEFRILGLFSKLGELFFFFAEVKDAPAGDAGFPGISISDQSSLA